MASKTATKTETVRELDLDALRDRLDARCEELPDSMPCCNPTCDQRCSWRTGKGRPARFCSNTCRARYIRRRAQLQADLAGFELLLKRTGAPTAETERYTNAHARIRWLLNHYVH